MAIVIDQEMPECCDKCWALDDMGDYPYCLISHTSKGYTFNIREKRMENCPMNEFEREEITKIINIYHEALHSALSKLMDEKRPEAEWIEDPKVGMSYYELCSHCGSYAHSKGYPAQGYNCGNFCPTCGAKMKNPHYHSVTIDDDY